MKPLAGFTIAIMAASASAAQPEPPITSVPSVTAQEENVIVVEGQRLSRELKNTRLLLLRPNSRIEFEIRADGTFKSSMNGQQSDFGKWRVNGGNVCFEGRARGTFCSPMLFGKRPGDRWVTSGLDGMRYEARLTSDD